MGMPLPDYTKIKDNCCISYLGYASEYMVQLNCLLPYLEAALPGLNIYLCCRDDIYHWFDNPKTFPLSEFEEKKNMFAHVKQLKSDMQSHPIINLLEESNIQYGSVAVSPTNNLSTKCVICPETTLPAHAMNDVQMDKAKRLANIEGYYTEINTDVMDAGWVIGVENGPIFLAASKGIRTTLIPTGMGTKLYKTMFPNAEIFSV
jgi:hypothetical protein